MLHATELIVETNYPTQSIRATPEYVLSVIVDNHRQQSQFDPETDANVVLTMDTTVAQWRAACDLVAWRPLGRALNDCWAIHFTDEQWKSVLTPPGRRTLRDVCNQIASTASRAVIQPVTLLGKPCATAGAFLTVRYLLEQAGADAREISPSMPLKGYLRRYLPVFLGPVSRLSPGALPPVKIRTPMYDRGAIGLLLSLLLIGAGWLVDWRTQFSVLGSAGVILGVLAAGLCYALIWIAAKGQPASVEFGNLKTFRDLATRLVEGAGAASE